MPPTTDPIPPSPVRRRALLTRAAQPCDQALRRTLDDVRRLADDTLGPAAHRLVLFCAEPGPEQPRLVKVELASANLRATRGLNDDDRALLTPLHGDLTEALRRHVGRHCPGGIAVAVDQGMVAAYWEEHCGHWDGDAALSVVLDPPGLLDPTPAEPYCCPDHLIPALAQRYDLELPTRRAPWHCDES